MDIHSVKKIEPYLSALSQYFRLFYEKEPWGDYQGCDGCYGALPLEDAPRFGLSVKICPQCQQPLGPFWSEARCCSALAKTNLFMGLFEQDKLKGWIIAKPVSEDVLAIDYMGLDPQLRRKKSKIMLMREAIEVFSLFLIRNRIKSLRNWSTNRMKIIPISSLQLYLLFEIEAEKMGFKVIQSTTHKNARNIFYALRSVGFHLTKETFANDRVLFKKHLY